MSANEDQQTFAKAIGNEKFSDPNRRKLFNDHPAYKELFELYPEWVEAFTSNPRWFNFFDNNIEVADFFIHQPTGGQQVQFWTKQGWFDRIARILTKDEIPEWIKQFQGDDGEFTELFEKKPAWALLYALEPEAKELFENNKKLTEHFEPHSEWAEAFASDPRWLDFLDNDIKVADFFSRQSAKFWADQGWFDRIARKMTKNKIPEWIKQFQGDDGKFTEFEKNPAWALLYALEPEAKELFENNKKLTDLFEPHPEWAEAFASDPRWFEFLDNDNFANFFYRQPAQFWSEQGWFDRLAKKLSNNDIKINGDKFSDWLKQFYKEEYAESFEKDPEWTLFDSFIGDGEVKYEKAYENIHKEDIRNIVVKFKKDKDFAELFFNAPEWFEL